MTTLDRIHKSGLETTDVLELIRQSEPFSFSIYMPTHRTGDEVLHRRDSKTLDGFIRNISKSLLDRGMPDAEIEKRLNPLKELVEDEEFWRQRTEGLVLFANESMLMTADLPIPVNAEFRIGNTFHLLPLVPLLTGFGRYYLLAIELERIRLFKAGRTTFEEIPVQEFIPERLEGRVGYDYEQKSLQFRSQQQQQTGSSYHGHAEADRDRKNEILRYFHEVDKGLRPVLKENPMPLILASQTYLAAIFKEACSYEPIVEGHLTTNLSEASNEALHRESWNLIAPMFEASKHTKWARFKEMHGTGKASAQLSRIIPAAFEGKVDSLFIEEGLDIMGSYDQSDRTISLADARDEKAESLLNLATHQTLKNGGFVFVLSDEDVPAESQGMLALFRY